MTKIDELMALGRKWANAAAVEVMYGAPADQDEQEFRKSLEAALEACRNDTLEKAAEKCEELTEDWGDPAEESGMLTCRNEIRKMKS